MLSFGIMSMQRVRNHGSFLQSYGLMKTIEAIISDAKCEFIDLPNSKTPETKKRSFISLLRFWYHKLKKDRVYNEYSLWWNSQKYTAIYNSCLKKYLGVSDRINYNTEYDAVIIGSDEVFNCTQEDASWGTSMALFGEGIESRKIISYAASFGYTTENRIIQYGLYTRIKDNLQKFHAISVRDENSVQIVKTCWGLNRVRTLIRCFYMIIAKKQRD